MLVEWFDKIFNPYGDIAYSVFIIAVTIFLSICLFKIIKRYLLRVKKGEGGIYERIMTAEIKIPLYLMICSIGFYYALTNIQALRPFLESMTDITVVLETVIAIYLARKAVNIIIVWYAAKDKRRIRIEQTGLMNLRKFIGLIIYLIGAIIVLNQLNVEITPLLASLGIGALAIAWALQPTLTNYFAGIHLTSDKSIRLGDFIQILGDNTQPVQGYVERVTWRSVGIRTFQNNIIVIPNAKLSESIIQNYDQPKQPMLIMIPVGVAYGSDLDKVEEVTLRVAKRIAKETGDIVENEDPFVRFSEFGDSNINFNVLFKVKRWESQFMIKHAFIKALMREYKKEGIEISFPCRNLYMRQS